jgi:hypothetical protein
MEADLAQSLPDELPPLPDGNHGAVVAVAKIGGLESATDQV